MSRIEESKNENGRQKTEILRPAEFHKDYVAALKSAHQGDMVWASSMMLPLNHHFSGILAEEFAQAAERGATVLVMPDSYTLRYIDNTYDIESNRANRVDRQYFELRQAQEFEKIRELQERGVQFRYVNPYVNTRQQVASAGIEMQYIDPLSSRRKPSKRLIMKRDHIKGYGVYGPQGGVAFHGGVNLPDSDFSQGDFMIKFTDQEIVSKLASFFERKFEGTLQQSVIPLNSQTTAFVDVGQSNESPILDVAYKLINHPDAAHIFITSQLPLDPVMLSMLHNQARKNVMVDVALSSQDHDHLQRPSGKALFTLNSLAASLSPYIRMHHFPNGNIHSKLLQVQLKNGLIHSFVGSNNYSKLGVWLGTAEMQLLSSDQELGRNLCEMFYELIKVHPDQNGIMTSYHSPTTQIPPSELFRSTSNIS